MSPRVTEADDGARLDVFVAKSQGISRASAGRLVDAELVIVNGSVARKAHKVASGDDVTIVAAEDVTYEAPAGVEVVFEDDTLAVVSKPSGVVVHAADGVREGTLVDALRARGMALAPRAGQGRPGIVHRLDRDVSGLLIVAKTDEAHERLVDSMRSREIERRYTALVVGVPPADSGKIDAPVGRHPRHRTRMAVVPDGRPSVTWFTVQERFDAAALLDVRLETGRTHQIRTHLASIGHPIVGDSAYGRDPALARRFGVNRPFLHAYHLAFGHPFTGEALSFTSSLPDDLSRALVEIRG